MESAPAPRRPRLLVLNQYYWPGLEATAHLLTELCESLAEEYDVHVVTGAVRAREPQPHRFVRNGVGVERVRSTTYERARLSLRALNYVTFLGGAFLQALRAPRPDVVLCMTDPPMIGAVAVADHVSRIDEPAYDDGDGALIGPRPLRQIGERDAGGLDQLVQYEELGAGQTEFILHPAVTEAQHADQPANGVENALTVGHNR